MYDGAAVTGIGLPLGDGVAGLAELGRSSVNLLTQTDRASAVMHAHDSDFC